MKKIIVALAMLLLAAPAMAVVTITCTETDVNEVTVSFVASGEAELVRAIALDVQVNDPNAWIEDINCVSGDYPIHPGSISIDAGGTVTDYGTCAGVHDGNQMISEQGSLYASGDPTPAQSGDLFILTLAGCTFNEPCDVTITVTQDALRGGIVMEDAGAPSSVVLNGCSVTLVPCPNPDPCPCDGDVDDNSTVNFSDLIAIYSEMVTQYPTGDPTYAYDIGKPVALQCADLDDSGSITFSDLITIYSEMVTQYPTGDPTYGYDIGCPF
jgi:hypothetical protein